MRHRVIAILFSALLGACSSTTIPNDVGPADAGFDSPAAEGGAQADSAIDAQDAHVLACVPTAPIPIWVDTFDSLPTRVHVPAEVDGREGVLLFDTGSTTTFISVPAGSPDPVVDAGALTVGECTRSTMGRPYAAEGARGQPALGYFGAEELLNATRPALDLLGEEFFPVYEGPVDGWLATPFETMSGSVLVRLTLDGVPVRLLLDTGSPHILWLGREPNPEDVESSTTDATGAEVTLYYGSVSAELTTGVVEELPILRVPSFPYLEQRRAEFGGELDGLLGLSALGLRTIVFDHDDGVLSRAP